MMRIAHPAVVCLLYGAALPPAAAGPTPRAPERLGAGPVAFEKNTGRYDPRVKYLVRSPGATVFLTTTEVVMVLREPSRGAPPRGRGPALGPPGMPGTQPPPAPRGRVLRMKLVGARAGAVAGGLEKQPGVINYLIGNDRTKWRTNVPRYARAKFAGVYPGIDVVYYGASGKKLEARDKRMAGASCLSPLVSTQLEYDFVVRPGADPSRIRLAFEGADRIRMAGGDLILSTPAGDVRMKRPYAYQTANGRRVQVACSYELRGSAARLRIARYDVSRPLVVDPVVVLRYSTFLGGSSTDQCFGVTVDASGCAYLAGASMSASFPTTPGAFDTVATSWDAFITKLNSSGSALVYSTLLGGGGGSPPDEYAYAIAADAYGAAYVTGTTASADFATTPGAYSRTYAGYYDVFITKLNPSGTGLDYSTLIGWASDDYGRAIALDVELNAYVAGWSGPWWWSWPHPPSHFPTTPGAYDRSGNGWDDGFVLKLNPSGSALVYSTLLGSLNQDYIYALAVDAAGCAVVTGTTSRGSDYPTTPGAFDTTMNGGWDAFVTKLDPTGSALVFSTFLGGPGDDHGRSVALDASGAVYVGGESRGTGLPTTSGALDPTGAYNSSGFVAKFVPSGAALAYCTYLGGGDGTVVMALGVDASGVAHVVGYTNPSDLPITPDAYDRTHNGYYDAFLTRLNTTGTAVLYSTFIGGGPTSHDYAMGIVLDASGAEYVCGYTQSTNFPTTPGAFDTTHNGAYDGFVLKFKNNVLPVATPMAATATAGAAQPIALGAADADGDPLTYSIVTGPSTGTLSGTPPNVSYTSSSMYHGPDSFTFRVHDGYEYSPPATVSITVEAPVPTALALLPNCGGPSDAPLALKVQGTGFVSDSVVRWNGADRPVTSVTPTEITATIGASDLATPATSTVTIYSSGPGGGTSNGLLFRIGQPAIQLVSVTVTKSGGVARARVTLKNAGAGTARALKVTIGKIQKSGFAPVSTTTALPIVLGDLAPGATVDVTPDLQFPGTSANVGDTVQVTVGGTYTGGSYNGWRKATVTAP